VDFIEHQGKIVVRVFVPRGNKPLYFLNHEIYVRVQMSSMRATPEQVDEILRRHYNS
jgi:predicted HTH transcriptional regulator